MLIADDTQFLSIKDNIIPPALHRKVLQCGWKVFSNKIAHKNCFHVDNENMIETFALQSYYFYLIQLWRQFYALFSSFLASFYFPFRACVHFFCWHQFDFRVGCRSIKFVRFFVSKSRFYRFLMNFKFSKSFLISWRHI